MTAAKLDPALASIFEEYNSQVDTKPGQTVEAECYARLAALAEDIAHGVRTVLCMIERDLIEEDMEQPSFRLTDYAAGSLLRMAVRAQDLLLSETGKAQMSLMHPKPPGKAPAK